MIEETRPLTTALYEGDSDLITTLVSSNINCSTCIFHCDGYTRLNDYSGKYCDGFAGLPEISLCFKWRDKRNPETVKRFEEGSLRYETNKK